MRNEETLNIVITSPIAIYLPRKTMPDKKYILNLNNYRNWHYIVSNQVKEAYAKEIWKQFESLHTMNKIALTFKYFKPSRRKCDRSNVYAIHEKFFCDALVKHGTIKDDSDEFIIRSVYLSVEYDKENPRVEVTIDENV